MRRKHEHELKVITKSKELTLLVYRWCNMILPEEEKFGLWSQMTRCAVSIPSNIAEGQQRSDKDFLRFIHISRGSLKELEVQLDIATNIYSLIYINENDVKEITEIEDKLYLLIEEIGKMTYSLMLKLNADAQAN